MTKQPPDTRTRLIDAAYELFYRSGFARVGVDAIATAAGVTKRTLYYHFESKDALIGAVLDVQHGLALARIERWAARGGDDDAREGVRRLFDELAAWCRRRDWRGSGFTRAAIEYSDAPGHPARHAARLHKAAVEKMLADVLARQQVPGAAQAAREIVLLVEGTNALVLIHGDASYAEAAGVAALALLDRRGATKRARKRAGGRPPASSTAA